MTLQNLEMSAKEAFSALAQGDLFIDVRSEIEFQGSHFSNSLNLPLLNSSERAEVGLIYKTEGQAAAIACGHQLVSGEKRQERTELWLKAVTNGARGLFCARGGLRSKIACEGIRERRLPLPRVEGGYKALPFLHRPLLSDPS